MMTSDPPTLPQTEAAVRVMMETHRVASSRPQLPEVARHRLAMFFRDYDDAVILYKQDAVTAYATAWRAARRREQRGVV